jgi:ATP-binding cassette subfamily F protein 3
MERCMELLRSGFPAMDGDIEQYLEGVLLATCEDGPDDIYDGVGEVLLDIDQSKSEEDVKQICTQLLSILRPDWANERQTTKGQSHMKATQDRPGPLPTLIDTNIPEPKKTSNAKIAAGNILNQGKKKPTKKSKEKGKKAADKGRKYGSGEVTVTQRWNEKQIKAAERTKEYSNNNDIHLEDFDIHYGSKELLLNADFTLEHGRRYGMVGRNGLGKTVLLRCLAEGSVKVPDHITSLHVEQEVEADTRSALQAVLQSDAVREKLLQEEAALTARLEAGEEAAGTDLTAVFEQLEATEAASTLARASIILAGLGFSPEMQQQETRQFSGGWRMRIALAQALFCRPDLLLLDEPTNMLDMQAVIWLERFLQTWASTLLVVSHNRSFLDRVSTNILHLHNKVIHTFKGNYTEYHEAASDMESGKYRENVQKFIDFNKYKTTVKVMEKVMASMKMLANLPVLETDQVKFEFPEVDRLKGPILTLSDVSFAYPGSGRMVLNGVDLSIAMDTKICFVGQNGSGKTTLINLLLGRLEPTEGRRSAHKHLRVGHFTQHFVDQLDMAVCAVELLQREAPGRRVEQHRKMLGMFGLGGSAALQRVESLSGGQKARVALAVLAAQEPNCLIMDEPTNHLDMDTVEALATALVEWQGGVVLVSHDERLLEQVGQELWVCRAGRVAVERGGLTAYRAAVERSIQL